MPNLTGDKQELDVLGAKRLLRLPNGLELSFGQIIALGGDFYGVPDQPIIAPSEGQNEKTTGHRSVSSQRITLKRMPNTIESRRQGLCKK